MSASDLTTLKNQGQNPAAEGAEPDPSSSLEETIAMGAIDFPTVQTSLHAKRSFGNRFVHRMFAALGNPAIVMELWNGQEIAPESLGEGEPVARVKIHDRQTFVKVLIDPMFQFGEGYTSGKITLEGNVGDFLCETSRAMFHSQTEPPGHKGLRQWLKKPRRNTLIGSQENIHRHYDIGNNFYRLWLDEQLLYTCAYFPTEDASLEKAQVAKMDHVCRKLQLQPGENVVEAGCGWGALALHMAKYYDVKVQAYNISKEQIAFARERAKKEGLGDRVEFVRDDWRNISGKFEAFVSVGMLEHVGRDNYQQLGNTIAKSITPNGRGLIHSIGQNYSRPFNSWIERRVFPGAYPPTIREMMEIFEPNHFSILDIENLRLHYARTLWHWLERFENNVDRVEEMFDKRFVRMWRLYLAGSMASFQEGGLQLFQILFTRPGNNDIPRTREHLYGDQCRSGREPSEQAITKSKPR